jgi:hypothetical protein
MKNELEFVGNFLNLCNDHGSDPKKGLEILNAQDWFPTAENIAIAKAHSEQDELSNWTQLSAQ